MKCLTCRGACCEVLEVSVPLDLPAQAEWARARSLRELRPGAYLVESRCPQLDGCGLCRLHEVGKPLECAVFPAGGAPCLDAVRERRTREQYAEIRDEGDPEVEEVYG